jgi:hypothetical protein
VIAGSNMTDAISGLAVTSGVTLANNTFGERAAPTTVYVSPNFPNPVAGQAPGAPAPSTAVFGYDAFATMHEAVAAVAASGTVTSAGTLNEDVVIAKNLTLDTESGGVSTFKSLTTNAHVSLEGSFTTVGIQLYNRPVTLAKDTTLTSSTGADITFVSTVDAATVDGESLSIQTTGLTQFGATVGTTPLHALTVTTGGPFLLDHNITTHADIKLLVTTGSHTPSGQNFLGADGTAATLTSQMGNIAVDADNNVVLGSQFAIHAPLGAVNVNGDFANFATAGTTMTLQGTVGAQSIIVGGNSHADYINLLGNVAFTAPKIVIDGNGGDDSFVVERTMAGTVTPIQGGTGNITVNVSSSHDATGTATGNLNTMLGALAISGGTPDNAPTLPLIEGYNASTNGNPLNIQAPTAQVTSSIKVGSTVILGDTTHIGDSSFDIDATRVLRTDSGPEVRIFLTGIQTLKLFAGNPGAGHVNKMELAQAEQVDTPALTKVFIDGGPGGNNLLRVDAARQSQFASMFNRQASLKSLIVGTADDMPIQFTDGTFRALYLFGTSDTTNAGINGDLIVNASSTPSLIDGGGGNDWLVGGSGGSVIFGGGAGNNFLFGTSGSGFLLPHASLAGLTGGSTSTFAGSSVVDGNGGNYSAVLDAILPGKDTGVGIGGALFAGFESFDANTALFGGFGHSKQSILSDAAASPLVAGVFQVQADDESFVTNLYSDVLQRSPDAAGLTSWENLLASGTTRADVTAAFLNSAEHRGLQVDHLYQTFLDRPADPSGRMFWVNSLINGMTVETVMAAFATSDEFKQNNPLNTNFIAALYNDLLSRAPDSSGLTSFTNALTNNTSTPLQVVQSILKSSERHLRVVDSLYANLLHRPADSAGEASWVGQLDASTLDGLSVTEAFLDSTEYYKNSK